MTTTKNHSEIISIAKDHFINGLSQKEISDKYFISRSKVSRLIKKSLDLKIVTITVKEEISRNHKLESKIKDKYSIKSPIVLNIEDEFNNDLKNNFYEVSAKYIQSLFSNKSYIGLGSGYTVNKIIENISKSNYATDMKIVQILGTSPKEQDYKFDSQLLVRKLSNILKCDAQLLFTPLYIENPIVRSLLLQEKIIKESIENAKICDIIITSVSSDINRIDSKFSEWSTYISKERLLELQKQNIVSVMLSHFINSKGEIVDKKLDEKIIGLSLNDIKKIKNVILIALESRKALGVHCALKTNAIDTLIVSSSIAKKLMLQA